MTRYIYIKLDSDLNKALELANEVAHTRIANRSHRTIVTDSANQVVYHLAVNGIHFTVQQ